MLPPEDMRETSDIVELLGLVPYSSRPPQRKIRAVALSPRFGRAGSYAILIKGNLVNPLTTVKWPLIIGFALAVAIAALVGGGLTFNAATLASLTRWLHIVFGVFWIGLLYRS